MTEIRDELNHNRVNNAEGSEDRVRFSEEKRDPGHDDASSSTGRGTAVANGNCDILQTTRGGQRPGNGAGGRVLLRDSTYFPRASHDGFVFLFPGG